MKEIIQKENPIVSIIVPVYRVEKYLQQCIESIRAQTLSDIEVILVDDGSPDSCPAICDAYSKLDNRIRVIHQKNAGLSESRNKGIQAARGNYICFVDGDDFLSPFYCEVLYDCLHNSNYDFSCCAVERFFNGVNPVKLQEPEERIVLSNEMLLEWQLSKKTEFGVWNKMYRRELFDVIHFAAQRIHEDVIWSADLAMHLHSNVIYTNQKLYYYRQRSEGIVAESSKKCSADRVYAGDYLIRSVKQRFPQLYEAALIYAVKYPWSFVDKIYITRKQSENKAFLNALSKLIKEYFTDYMCLKEFSPIVRFRMKLFVKSKFLYGFNVYMRLIRNYLCRLLGKNPYKSEHSI